MRLRTGALKRSLERGLARPNTEAGGKEAIE
jgi:hypothetical protein